MESKYFNRHDEKYFEKLEKEFAKCKNGKAVKAKMAGYQKWNDCLEWTLTLGGIGTIAVYGLAALSGDIPPYFDKLAHVGKGILTSRATSKIFNGAYRKILSRLKGVSCLDDDVREKVDPIVPRIAAEAAGDALTAVGWEVWEGDYDFPDAGADGIGHALNVSIMTIIEYRKNFQYEAASQRLEELGEDPLEFEWRFGFYTYPEPINLK